MVIGVFSSSTGVISFIYCEMELVIRIPWEKEEMLADRRMVWVPGDIVKQSVSQPLDEEWVVTLLLFFPVHGSADS